MALAPTASFAVLAHGAYGTGRACEQQGLFVCLFRFNKTCLSRFNKTRDLILDCTPSIWFRKFGAEACARALRGIAFGVVIAIAPHT
jgi:hypothetical protein